MFQTLKAGEIQQHVDSVECLCLIRVFSLVDYYSLTTVLLAGDGKGQRYTSLKQINLPLDLKGTPARGINIYNYVCLSDLGFIYFLAA